jgi:hypothetical protein
MNERVSNDTEIINAFQEKGWSLYRKTPNLNNLIDLVDIGPASELNYYDEKQFTHYIILPKVENAKSALDIELKIDELAKKDSLPRLHGVIHKNPLAGAVFQRERVLLIEHKNNIPHEIKYSDILRVIRHRLNEI